MRKVWRDSFGGVLELVAVSKDEVVSLGAVLSKVLIEFGGRFGLDVADLRAEAITNSHETLVGTGVPRLIRDRSGGEECDFERAPGGGVAGGFRVIARVVFCTCGSDGACENTNTSRVERCGKATSIAGHGFFKSIVGRGLADCAKLFVYGSVCSARLEVDHVLR
jgi:hypothetical protein